MPSETVIAGLEDAEDYQAFEEAVTADYNVETAVERELVLRLASVLWRLRRATGIESALFESVMDQSKSPSPTKSQSRTPSLRSPASSSKAGWSWSRAANQTKYPLELS
jgi:hypothetical protein